MPIVTLDLDADTFDRLMDFALNERRPISWQAEMMLRQSLGLPFPYKQVKAAEMEGEGERE